MREMDGFIKVDGIEYYFSLKYGRTFSHDGLAVPFNVIIEEFHLAKNDDKVIVTPRHYKEIYEQLIERIRND